MKKLKTLFILLLLVALVPLGALAARGLEATYPTFGGITVTADTTFPEYLNYIYYFIIGMTGVAALIILLWGGVLWLAAAGSPNQINKSKEKIIGGLSGIAIILGAHLILTTINPQIFGVGSVEPILPNNGYCLRGDEFRWVNDDQCPEGWNESDEGNCSFIDGTVGEKCCQASASDRIYCYDKNISTFAPIGFVPKEVNFRESFITIRSVVVFSAEDYQGTPEEIYNTVPYGEEIIEGTWKSLGISNVQSSYLVRIAPGIRVFPSNNCEYDFSDLPRSLPSQTLTRVHTSLGEYAERVASIQKSVRNLQGEYEYWGGVFFSNEGLQGNCGIIFGDGDRRHCFVPGAQQIGQIPGGLSKKNVYSAHIFRREISNQINGKITFYPLINYQEVTAVGYESEGYTVSAGDIISRNNNNSIWTMNLDYGGGRSAWDQENILSVKIDGRFLVVLNSEPDFTGRCMVLAGDKPSLIGSYILGDDLEENKVRSIAIIPLK